MMACMDGDEVAPEPLNSAEAAIGTDDSSRLTTAARALSLGTALTGRLDPLDGLDDDLATLGVLRLPQYWGSWEERVEATERSDLVLSRFGLLDHVRAREAQPNLWRGGGYQVLEQRAALWSHDPTKSTITLSLPELQDLLDHKAGTGQWHGANKEVVNFGVVIGLYRPQRGGHAIVTTRGTIHYSKSGAHVVPAEPLGWGDVQ